MVLVGCIYSGVGWVVVLVKLVVVIWVMCLIICFGVWGGMGDKFDKLLVCMGVEMLFILSV